VRDHRVKLMRKFLLILWGFEAWNFFFGRRGGKEGEEFLKAEGEDRIDKKRQCNKG